MELQILIPLLFYCLISLGYAFYNKKVIYLVIITSFMLILLGANLLSEGIQITYAGSYGFINNTTSVTGIATSTKTFQDNYISASGMFLILFAIASLFLTFFYLLKGSEEENLVLEREE